MSEFCTESKAKDVAKNLDESHHALAAQGLYDCSRESTSLNVDESKFRKFVESVSDFEKKGVGLDLTVKYSTGRLTAMMLEGFEIE